MRLFFDTETTGKLNRNLPLTAACQPDLVQLAAVLTDGKRILDQVNLIVEPDGWEISPEVAGIHGISHELACEVGIPRKTVLSAFSHMCRHAEYLIAHNLDFDHSIMETGYYRIGAPSRMEGLKHRCTMKAAAPILKLPKRFRGKPGDEYKWPTLTECHQHFFGEPFDGAHNAMVDVEAMIRVCNELIRLGAIEV